MAPHSSTLAWKIPWMEEPGGLQSMGSLSIGHDWLHFHFSLSWIGEGHGNPLQCSCLENPRDEGAWWAVLYGVAQSWTWLKWLSSSSSSLNCSTCGCSAVGTEYNEPFCRLCYCYEKSDSNCFSISAILQSTNNVIIYRYFANNSFFFLCKHRICH